MSDQLRDLRNRRIIEPENTKKLWEPAEESTPKKASIDEVLAELNRRREEGEKGSARLTEEIICGTPSRPPGLDYWVSP